MIGIDEFFNEGKQLNKEVVAVEGLVFQVQLEIQRALNEKQITQKELASRLNVSQANISQMMSSKGANLTLKTIARIFYALGEGVELKRPETKAKRLTKKRLDDQLLRFAATMPTPRAEWVQPASNENNVPAKLLVA